MKKKSILLVLTGGLGNQLFQMRFMEQHQDKYDFEIFLDVKLGKPRGNGNIPEAFHFGAPFKVLERKHSKIAAKSIGYLLRSGYAPRYIEQSKLLRQLVRILISLIQSWHFRRILIAYAPKTLGFDPELKFKARNSITMGYFQSYLYVGDSISNYKFSVTPQSEMISKYRELANEERPIMVHVRRGDYEAEGQFGLLGPEYYEEAISHLEKISNSNKIWLFSDDPQKALTVFNEKQKKRIRIIEEVDGSPSHTLEVMRFGAGYVIANSTYSWWAARSAYDAEAQVAAPAKWFKGLKSPEEIIPVGWHLFESDFL